MPILKLSGGDARMHESHSQREIAFSAFSEGDDIDANGAALVLPNDVNVLELGDAVKAFDAIVLEFPKFADGRAYSQARRLREQLGFQGEIRARGDLGRDQALFMARSGVSAFEIDQDAVSGFREALQAFSVFYQPSADASQPAWRRRLEKALAA